MPQIDQLSEAMQRQGATRATLVSDAAMTFNVGGAVAQGTVMSATQLQKFLDEIVPTAQRGQLFQDGVFSFIHTNADGPFTVSVRRQSPRFHVTVEPANRLQPKIEPVIPPPPVKTMVIPEAQPVVKPPEPIFSPLEPTYQPAEPRYPQPPFPSEPPAPKASSNLIFWWQGKVLRQPITSWPMLWKARQHKLAQALVLGGSLLMCLGLCLSFLQLPVHGGLGWKDSIVGTITVIQSGNGAGSQDGGDLPGLSIPTVDPQSTAILTMDTAYILALTALVAAALRWYEMASHCAQSLGALAYLLAVTVKMGVDKLISEPPSAKNPITNGIPQTSLSQITFTWAWELVLAGALIIVVSALLWKLTLPKKAKNKYFYA